MFNILGQVAVIIALISNSLCVFAQSEREYNDSLRKVAQQQIVELQSSFLIVRLDSKSEQIEYYIKHENHSAAQSLKESTDNFNAKIIEGMRASFQFCPVYFMDSKDTPKLMEAKLNEITFYSDDLLKDPTIHPPKNSTYFIGEYSFTKDENMKVDSTEYYGSNNLGVPALVIMDQHLNQLKRPFPYYCKFSSKLLNLNKLKGKILKWNSKLNNYYSMNNKKLE